MTKIHVLVVEDSPIGKDIQHDIAGSDFVKSCDVATCYTRAEQLLQSQKRYAVVLLDNQLPYGEDEQRVEELGFSKLLPLILDKDMIVIGSSSSQTHPLLDAYTTSKRDAFSLFLEVVAKKGLDR